MLNQHKILRVLQLITYLQESPHKTINQLASFLDSTERTVYRYLDLLRECGFDLHKDHNQRYYIEQQATDGIYFTPEEAQLLKSLVLSTGKSSKLKDTLLSKIYMGSELPMVATHLLHAKNGKIVERLTKAKKFYFDLSCHTNFSNDSDCQSGRVSLWGIIYNK